MLKAVKISESGFQSDVGFTKLVKNMIILVDKESQVSHFCRNEFDELSLEYFV